ncbi:MAG: hypothetical protein ABSE46_07870 [Terracidiphilus sp.]|jgi:hypothetical protein
MVSKVKTSPATAKAKPVRRVKKPAAVASQPENHKSASLAPVVVEAGSRSQSSLRHLEQGTGPLMHEIGQIVQAIHAAVPEPVPITIVYRERRSSSSRSTSLFELLPFFRMLPI